MRIGSGKKMKSHSLINQWGSSPLIYIYWSSLQHSGLILGLHPANERRRYFVTTSLIGWCKPRIIPEHLYLSVHVTWLVGSSWLLATQLCDFLHILHSFGYITPTSVLLMANVAVATKGIWQIHSRSPLQSQPFCPYTAIWQQPLWHWCFGVTQKEDLGNLSFKFKLESFIFL